MAEQQRYSSSDDYCSRAEQAQSVPSREEYGLQHPNIDPRDYDSNRAQTLYSCNDQYQMATIQDNQIYIATTDGQHDQIASEKHVDAQGGLSGYFSDQATVDACKNGETLDNAKYNEMCQIAPYRPRGIDGEGAASYKPHIDCFEIDREALYKNYGTYDFNAAIGKCEANTHLGGGGGNQGFNPHLAEMIDNGSLKYNESKSFSDTSISKSQHVNPNNMSNSIVPEDKADEIYANAQIRAKDCVKNNTSHPSQQARNNGFEPNANPVSTATCNAKTYGDQGQINGTTPDQAPNKPFNPGIEKPVTNQAEQKSAEEAAKAAQGTANNAQGAMKGPTGISV